MQIFESPVQMRGSGGEAPRKFLGDHALQTLGKHRQRPFYEFFWLEDLALKVISGTRI